MRNMKGDGKGFIPPYGKGNDKKGGRTPTDQLVDVPAVTAVRSGFAPEYETDDSEIPLLWDIREQQIKSYGQKLFRCEFAGADETVLEGCIGDDAAEVGEDVVPMGRILIAGSDMHYTNYDHTYWMNRSGIQSSICEDDPKALASIYHLGLKVLPPSEVLPSGCMVAPMRAGIDHGLENVSDGTAVELAGLTTVAGRWAVKIVDGRVVDVGIDKIKRRDTVSSDFAGNGPIASEDVAVRQGLDIPSKAVAESDNFTYSPYAAWCEMYQVAAGGEDVADVVGSCATMLVVVEVTKKGDDPFVTRYFCAFLDRLQEEKITLSLSIRVEEDTGIVLVSEHCRSIS